MGILILFFLAVGTGTTVYYVGKGVVILYRKLHPHDVKAVTGITELQIALNQMAIEPLPNDRPRNPAYASLASLEVKALIVKRIEEIENMPAWDRHVMDLKDGLLSVRESVMKHSAFSRFSCKRSTNYSLFSSPFRWLNPWHANSTATVLQILPASSLRASYA